MKLIDKPDDAHLPEKMPWERDDEPISEARWRKHRVAMLAEWAPGHRPTEWWAYEAKQKRPRNGYRDTNTLFEMGELSEAELAELMPVWREQFAKAQAEDFAYCIGQLPGHNEAHWLKGIEARKAFLEWTGIPDKIIRQFDREWHKDWRAIAKSR